MLVFVYGTLKKNMRNHHVMEKIFAEFVSPAETIEKYPMFDLGNGFPYLQDNPKYGLIIQGELYHINKITEKQLDHFEGVPQLYKKGLIDVEFENMKYENVNCYFIADELTDDDLNDVDLFEEWVE